MRTEGILRVDGRELHVVGTVRGLASEAVRVEEAFERVRPQALALGVGPEDLAGLDQVRGGADYEHEYSEADDVYAHYLEQFGKVALPPPDLIASVRAAHERGVPLIALDLPEVEYVDRFTKAISGWQLLRYQRVVRKLARRPPSAEDPMAFHLAWDREVGRLSGFAALERAREEHMARRLQAADLPPGRILVLVEGARVEGLLRALERPQAAAQP